jgi:hypothetical protein
MLITTTPGTWTVGPLGLMLWKGVLVSISEKPYKSLTPSDYERTFG